MRPLGLMESQELGTEQYGTEVVAVEGFYDADEQVWVGDSEATAGVCTGATICVGPICYKYTRMFDVAAICVW